MQNKQTHLIKSFAFFAAFLLATIALPTSDIFGVGVANAANSFVVPTITFSAAKLSVPAGSIGFMTTSVTDQNGNPETYPIEAQNVTETNNNTTLTVETSDASVATASISGNDMEVYGVKPGTATIDVVVSGTDPVTGFPFSNLASFPVTVGVAAAAPVTSGGNGSPVSAVNSGIQYIPCDASVLGLNPGLNCGYTKSFLQFPVGDSCSISGAGNENGLIVLGGQVCSIGGTDQPGFYQNSNGQQELLSDYAGGPPPGWSYDKTSGFTQIPDGVVSSSPDSPFGTDGFYGGTVSFAWGINQATGKPSADDEATLQVGSQQSSLTGCTCAVTSQSRAGCPSTNAGPTSFSSVPAGAPVVFNTTNMCAPKSPYAQWGGAAVNNFVLSPVTVCYTAAYMQATGGYQYITDYVPTAAGTCMPKTLPQGTIVVNSVASSTGAPVAASWSITGSGATLSGNGVTTETYPNVAANTLYTIAPGATPTGYDGNPTVYSDGNPVSSELLANGSTTTFTIVWQKSMPPPKPRPTTPSAPALSAAWTDGSNATSVNLGSGQTTVIVPLQFRNSGGSGSVVNVNGCVGSSPTQGVIAFGHCPAMQLTATTSAQ